MKKIKLEVLIEVDDIINTNDIMILNSDVIDGFEITRRLLNNQDDLTENFYLQDAKIISSYEIKED